MGSVIRLRTDYSPAALRRLAKHAKDINQSRRLLSLAAIMDGMNRGDAARIGGMDRQTLRDWVHRFNTLGPNGLKDKHGGGPRVDLQRVIKERFGVDYHERHVGALLKDLGFACLSGRPKRPGQDAHVMEEFKKNWSRALSAHIGHLPKGKPIEVWFQML